jgi:hypothetical protein
VTRQPSCHPHRAEISCARCRRQVRSIGRGVDFPLAIFLFGHPGEIEEHEGELERTPLRLFRRIWALLLDDRLAAAVGRLHGGVHDGERIAGERIAFQEFYTAPDARTRGLHVTEREAREFLAAWREAGKQPLLFALPRGVLRRQRIEGGAECSRALCGGGGERGHAELNLVDIFVGRPAPFLPWAGIAPHPRDRQAMPILAFRLDPAARRVAADRVFADIAVVHVAEPQVELVRLVGGQVAALTAIPDALALPADEAARARPAYAG